jgi:hypothetical protein
LRRYSELKRVVLLLAVTALVIAMLAVGAGTALAALNCNDTRTVCSGGLGGDPVIPEGATGGGQGGHSVSDPSNYDSFAAGGAGGGGGGTGGGSGGLGTHSGDNGEINIVRGNNAENDNAATGYCTYDPTTAHYVCKGNKQG